MIGTNYINGEFVDNNKCQAATFASINPSTEEAIGTFPNTKPQIVRDTVEIARKSFNSWRKLSRIARAEYFDKLCEIVKKRKDEIAKVISLETGKSLNESYAEINESLHTSQYTFAQGREPFGEVIASEIAEKDINVFRKPKGVIGIISPWNFSLAIGGFWCAAPALLEGNTVVFKPSEETPYSGHLIAEMYHEAGFPPGVFNVIHGIGESTGAVLVHSDVDHICFTGSVSVGQFIRRHCADTLHKTSSCELGSKSAVIIFDDANKDIALKAAITSAFKLSGQRCVSSGRILIQRKIYNDFCEMFVDAAKKLTVGNPFDNPAPDFGPLINKTQMERVAKYNELTIGKVNILLEGKRIGTKGFFLSPHVYATEWLPGSERPFLQEEVFGPHVALIPFEDTDDACRIYNDTKYGLSVAVITNNMHIARYMRDNCDYGMGYLNLSSVGAESHCEFGGIKASGHGGSSAAGTFKTVTHEVTWTSNYQKDGFQMAQGLK